MTKTLWGFLFSVALGYMATLMYVMHIVENTVKTIFVP